MTFIISSSFKIPWRKNAFVKGGGTVIFLVDGSGWWDVHNALLSDSQHWASFSSHPIQTVGFPVAWNSPSSRKPSANWPFPSRTVCLLLRGQQVRNHLFKCLEKPLNPALSPAADTSGPGRFVSLWQCNNVMLDFLEGYLPLFEWPTDNYLDFSSWNQVSTTSFAETQMSHVEKLQRESFPLSPLAEPLWTKADHLICMTKSHEVSADWQGITEGKSWLSNPTSSMKSSLTTPV